MLKNVFKSATTKLTSWYLAMFMLLSISFSMVIYQMASGEIHSRLEHFRSSVQGMPVYANAMPNKALELKILETEVEAADNLSMQLFYINILVLFFGGLASYYLARYSLKPIEKAHDAQSRFTSDASHELRTPLAVMKTELEVALSDEKATVSDLRETLMSNLEEVDKLSKLSEMLLNLSQLDNIKLKIEPVNLTKVTEFVVKDFRSISNRIKLETKKQPLACANEMAIIDLIKILIDNAVKYSPKDSIIHIKVFADKEMARFEITNSGRGIEPNKLPHIFDRFYRADSARTNGHKNGYGLGLALAKNIIEMHNGELSVTSELNNETTFSFGLPLKKTTKQKSALKQ